mgnify:CR=1 FL=1
MKSMNYYAEKVGAELYAAVLAAVAASALTVGGDYIDRAGAACKGRV